MTFEMTRDEAKHLARYIAEMRLRMGTRHRWDAHGIEHALGEARTRATSPDLAGAAIRAAANPANRTPAVIGMDGPHWRGTEGKPRPIKVERRDRCSVCSEPRDRCRSLWVGDHEFDPTPEDRDARKRPPDKIHLIVQATKAEVQPIAPPPPPREHKPDPRADQARVEMANSQDGSA